MGRPRPSVRLKVPGDRGMPITGRVDGGIGLEASLDRAVERWHDVIAIGHSKGSAGAEIALHVDHKQRLAGSRDHGDTLPPGMPGALSTDLYEITMVAGYVVNGATGSATFELWVRDLPKRRRFLVAAGLEQALEYLDELHFTPDDIRLLRTVPALDEVPATFFTEYLPTFLFTGDVWALPEGTPFFAREPILRVTAPTT